MEPTHITIRRQHSLNGSLSANVSALSFCWVVGMLYTLIRLNARARATLRISFPRITEGTVFAITYSLLARVVL